jgi:crotonobetainyl-CoA:carnitine CoA-transferase CaiB-like acyl-CoA transferase
MSAARRPDLPPHQPRPAGAPLALEGLRVIDFTRMLSGPYSTQQLADLGAEVIKIETPVKGDDSRHYTTTALAGECAFYLSTNRNKKSVTLDLKTEAGREVARELIAGADIVMENYTNGVMERFGLDYPTVSASHPRLIYCSISGWGRDDVSETSRRSYDAIAQAASGFMSLTGEPDGLPMRTTVPILDTATAMTATGAVLAAVVARERLGRGQYVEVALVDVALACLTMYGMAYLVSGEEMQRNGNRAPQTAPSDAYATATGPIFLTCGNDSLFRRLAEAIGQPELAEDPQFRSNTLRVQHEPRLTGILRRALAGDTQAHWVDRLSRAGVPVAPVNSIPQAYASADVSRRGLLSGIPHPTAGTMPNVAAPMRLSLTPAADPVAPPLLGQHNEEVFGGVLGYDASRVAQLRSRGAFGPAAADAATPATGARAA